MILYYVAAESDTDWDLDSTDHYKTKKEAEIRKKELEEMYGEKYSIWEVD